MGPSSPHFSPQCPLLCSGRDRERSREPKKKKEIFLPVAAKSNEHKFNWGSGV